MKEDVKHVLFLQNPQKILVRLLCKGQTWGLLPLEPLQEHPGVCTSQEPLPHVRNSLCTREMSKKGRIYIFYTKWFVKTTQSGFSQGSGLCF